MTQFAYFLVFILSVSAASFYMMYRSSKRLEKVLLNRIEELGLSHENMYEINRDLLKANEELLEIVRKKTREYAELYCMYNSLFNSHFDLSQKFAAIQETHPN